MRVPQSRTKGPGPIRRCGALIVLGAVIIAGCDWNRSVDKITAESEKWRKESQGWQQKAEDLTKQVEAASKQVAELREGMVEAADSLDPLAIKAIYADNSELRTIVESLQAQLQAAARREGVIDLSTEKLRLRVVRYSGEVQLDAWIDSEKNKIADGIRLRSAAVRLLADDKYRTAVSTQDWMVSEVIQGRYAFADRKKVLGDKLRGIDDSYKKSVETAFKNAIQSGSYFSAGSADHSFYIHENLLRPGERNISIRVTPVNPNVASTVVVSLEKYLKGGAVENIKTYQFTPSKAETKVMTLWVRFK